MYAVVRHIFRKTKYRIVEGKVTQSSLQDVQAAIYEELRTMSTMLPEGGHRLEISMKIIEEPGKPLPSLTTN